MAGSLTVQRNPTALNVKDFANFVGNGTNDDTSAINATLLLAHNNGGGDVVIPYSTPLITAPLVIYSNTRLLVDPMCTITLQAGSNCNMLKNASTIPSRVVADAVTTAASATITSATANFTSGDIGKYVGILGAGPNYGLGSAPGSLYATIASVTNSTTAVLSVVATLSTTNATLNVWPARDSNITIIGGTWNKGNADSIYQSLNGHSFLLRRVDGLILSQIKQVSTGSNGIGGRYAYAIGDCTKVIAEKLDFSTAGDGVHFTGPGQYLTVRDIRGTTGDDHVAFTALDGQSQAGSTLGDVNGSFSDILVENIQSNASWSSIRLSGGTTSGNVATTITRCKVKDLTGSTVNYSVIIPDYGGNTNISCEIENVSVATGTNFPLVKLQASLAQEIILKGIKWPNAPTPTSGVIQVLSGPTALIIKDLEFLYSGGTGGPLILFNTTFTRSLVIDGVSAPMQPTGSIDVLRIATASAVMSTLRITNVFRSGSAGSGNIINCTAASYNLQRVELSDIINWSGGIFTASADSVNTLFLTAANIQSIGTLFTLQSPATLYLSNVYHAQASGNAIYANSAAATPVRVYVGNASISAGTFLARSATQALSAMGLTASADLSILTPTDQDIVNNTNAALSCGAGLCVFHTGGTGNGWKNLYSGLTY